MRRLRWLLLAPLLCGFQCPEEIRPYQEKDYELAWQAFVQGGDLEAALRLAHAALCQGRDGKWRRRAAQVARWLGRAELALEHLERLAREGDQEALSEALKIARQLADYPTLYRLLLLRKRTPEVVAELARTALLLGRYREAARWYETGYRLTGDPRWLFELAEMAYFLDWTEEERRALEALLLRHSSPEAAAQLADLYLWRGELERAYRVLEPFAEALLEAKNPLPLELAWRLGKVAAVERWLARFPEVAPLWLERWALLAEGRRERFERLFKLWRRTGKLPFLRQLLLLARDREELERLLASLRPEVVRKLTNDAVYLLARARLAFFREEPSAWSWLRAALERGREEEELLTTALALWVAHASRRELLWLKPELLALPDDPFWSLKLSFLVRTEEPFLALDLLYHRLAAGKEEVALLVALIDLLQATDQVALADSWRAYLLDRFAPRLSPLELALFQLLFRPQTLLEKWPELWERAERQERWRDLLLSLAARIESPELMRLLRALLYRVPGRKLPGWNVPFALEERDSEALWRELGRLEEIPYRDRVRALEALGWPERALGEARESFGRNGRDTLLYQQLHRLSWRLARRLEFSWLQEESPTLTWRRFRLRGELPLAPGKRLSLSWQRDFREDGRERTTAQLELTYRHWLSPRSGLELGLFQSLDQGSWTGLFLGGRYRVAPALQLRGRGWWRRREGWEISLDLAQQARSSGGELLFQFQPEEGLSASGRLLLERFEKGGRGLGHHRLAELRATYALPGTPVSLLGTVLHRDYFSVGRGARPLFFAEGWQLRGGLLAEHGFALADLHLGSVGLQLEGSWIEELGLGGSVFLTWTPPSLAARDRLRLEFGYMVNQATPRTKEGAFHVGLSFALLF